MAHTSPAPDPAEVADRLRLPVTRLARLLRQQDSSGLGPTLTSALATIGREGPLSLGDLAAVEQVAAATISRAVAKLEDRGMVLRRTAAGDGRSFTVELTDAGREQLASNRQRRQAWLSRQLAALEPDELARLEAAVGVIERLTSASPPCTRTEHTAGAGAGR
ncbi:MAG: MarR family winged helix-turn-helix transcriptional regulator [Acidimicrobiia bacterium]